MPLKYILYGKIPKIRKMLVVDGQPFYCSTGRNSGRPDRWLPFIMLFEDISYYEKTRKQKLDFLLSPYDPKKVEKFLEKISDEDDGQGYIIKSKKAFLVKNIPSADFTESNESKNRDFYNSRLPLKKWLIISSRLNNKHYEDQELKDAGLNEEQIKIARIPISINEKSSAHYKSSRDSNDINQWLITQGAHSKSALTNQSYQQIWGQTSAHSEDDIKATPISDKKIILTDSRNEQAPNPVNLAKARKILQDYIKNGSSLMLWLTFHKNRHFVTEVSEALKENHLLVGDLLSSIKTKIQKNGKTLNPEGSLAKRFQFIEAMLKQSNYIRPISHPIKKV